MHTLLYLKWITNKVLLYIAQGTLHNIIRQPGWEGVWERMNTFVCAESLFCSPESVKTLLIGYTPIQNKKFRRKSKVLKGKIFLTM